MRGNEARFRIVESQLKENSMEYRVPVVENDIRNLKESVAKLFDGLKSANDAITKLLTGQAELRGDINTLRVEMRAEMGTVRAEMGTLRAEVNGRLEALETKIMRWFVATALSCAALAFSAAKLFS